MDVPEKPREIAKFARFGRDSSASGRGGACGASTLVLRYGVVHPKDREGASKKGGGARQGQGAC